MKFRPGQKVVCTNKSGEWFTHLNITAMTFWQRLKILMRGNKAIGPAYNQIVTVDNGDHSSGAIPLKEYNQEVFGRYQDCCFEPLVKSEVLENELAEIFSSEKELRQN